jgi:hypothetical protein
VTIFYKIWYKHCALRGQTKYILFKTLQSAITKLEVHELMWKREQDHLFSVSENKYYNRPLETCNFSSTNIFVVCITTRCLPG